MRRLPGRSDRKFRDPGEGVALEYLESMGHLLLRHNYHLGFVEVDLITLSPADRTLHFVEVKRWRSGSLLHPAQTVTRRRRSLLRKASASFLVRMEEDPSSVLRPVLGEEGCLRDWEALVREGLGVRFELAWVRPGGVVVYEFV